MDWKDDARCAELGLTPDVFYPDPALPDDEYEAAEQEAASVCASCPVKLQCHMFATQSGETDGIWGGVNFLERKANDE